MAQLAVLVSARGEQVVVVHSKAQGLADFACATWP
jgi:hypothetical protein